MTLISLDTSDKWQVEWWLPGFGEGRSEVSMFNGHKASVMQDDVEFLRACWVYSHLLHTLRCYLFFPGQKQQSAWRKASRGSVSRDCRITFSSDRVP